MPQPRQYTDAAERQRAYRQRQAENIRIMAQGISTPIPPMTISNIPPQRRWNDLQSKAYYALEMLRDEMQAYYNDRTERWQESEAGTAMQERIETVENLLSELEEME